MRISDRGFYIGRAGRSFFDHSLAIALAERWQGKSVWDFGCGMGKYVHALQSAGINASGVDGNPETELLTNGLCRSCDLSQLVSLECQECVLCLEVGEHIPEEFSDAFLDNIVKHANTEVVLSWAVPGQGGTAHVNERPNSWVIHKMALRGFSYAENATHELRRVSTLRWLRRSLMVFHRAGAIASTSTGVLLLTHVDSPLVRQRADELYAACRVLGWSFAVGVDEGQTEFPDATLPVWRFTHKALEESGYRLLRPGRWRGVCDVPLLAWSRENRHDHYWLVEYDVACTGGWLAFFQSDFLAADLVVQQLRTPSDRSRWVWWRSLRTPRPVCRLSTYCPIFRISYRAARLMDDVRRNTSWGGHAEALLPTAVAAHGMELGTYAPFVTPKSFRYRPGVVPNGESVLLWHPVKK